MMQSASKWIMTAMVCIAVATATGRNDTSVESTRQVSSPDGKKSVVVDRFTPTVDGHAERFSGRMLLRVSSTDGSPARQRYIEASQVRVIQPPVWLDGSRLCAFVYNVAKNSNGIVYFEPEANRAIQVEFVMPARQMAASGKVEQELTSLEITEFSGTETLKTRNIPWNGGSAFPLVLPPLPEFHGQPYGLEFYQKITGALDAYKKFLSSNSIDRLEPEQASESFSENEKWLGLLACDSKSGFLLGVPLGSHDPTQVLSKTRIVPVKDVVLSCLHQAASESTDPGMSDSRYLTGWKSNDVLHVLRESYEMESEEPSTTPVAELNVATGAMKQTQTTSTATASSPGSGNPAEPTVSQPAAPAAPAAIAPPGDTAE